MTGPWAAGVVIPAHDEEGTVARCLRSVLRALRASAAPAAFVVLVADACTDRTMARAHTTLGTAGEVVSVRERSVGAARAYGALRCLERLASVPEDRIWLLNTDADTVVPEDWVRRQLAFARGGAAAVAGRVALDREGGRLDPSIARHFAQSYTLGADGTHAHVHGANLGVRADAYRDTGGWLPKACSEDHCLWDRLRARGWPVVSPTASVVATSPRLRGRAPGGFASDLAALGRAAS